MQCDILPIFAAAQSVIGATAPNPPVAAGAFDFTGRLLGTGVHVRAGAAHAEAALLARARKEGWFDQIKAIYVTLEPCNHHGKTPPCAQALLESGIKRVMYGINDPNPKAAGGGAFLKEKGVNLESGVGADKAIMSLLPFLHRVKTGKPLVVVKQALRKDGSMIPPQGQKTFTGPDQLWLAHRMRKSCDRLVTGSGTVMADKPSFTVRHLKDHPNKQREMVILDRRGYVSDSYIREANMRGFDVTREQDLDTALYGPGLITMVEAGPKLLNSVQKKDAWDIWVTLFEEGHVEISFHDRLSVYGTLDPQQADLLWAV